jgi:hypothetical protein
MSQRMLNLNWETTVDQLNCSFRIELLKSLIRHTSGINNKATKATAKEAGLIIRC